MSALTILITKNYIPDIWKVTCSWDKLLKFLVHDPGQWSSYGPLETPTSKNYVWVFVCYLSWETGLNFLKHRHPTLLSINRPCKRCLTCIWYFSFAFQLAFVASSEGKIIFNYLVNNEAKGVNWYVHKRILSEAPYMNKVYINTSTVNVPGVAVDVCRPNIIVLSISPAKILYRQRFWHQIINFPWLSDSFSTNISVTNGLNIPSNILPSNSIPWTTVSWNQYYWH